MKDVSIAPKDGAKGRTFHATCLATVEADAMWEGGTTTSDVRPVWAMFGGSEQELRPFMANVRLGRKIQISHDGYQRKNDHMEFLKSAGYRITWQREEEGSIATICLPDFFLLDPGMIDPEGARFIILPPTQWSKSQKIDVAPIVTHAEKMYPQFEPDYLASLVPLAFLFCSYLDRRTRCPLVSDGRFYMQVFLACLEKGLATWTSNPHSSYHQNEFGVHHRFRFTETNTSQVVLNPGVCFYGSHESIESVLSKEVSNYYANA